MRIIVLPSMDGPHYTKACLVPDSMDDDQALASIHAGIVKAVIDAGDEWCFGDIRNELVKSGFGFPDVIIGPAWDIDA